MVAIQYAEICDAFEFASTGAPGEYNAYISLDTGQIYLVSELASMDEEVPKDLEESDRYIAVPHKNDLDLGKSLVLRFAHEALPDSYDRVRSIFQRKGAYARFKDLLESKGALEAWYRFEEQARDRALREWCGKNDIQIIEGSRHAAA